MESVKRRYILRLYTLLTRTNIEREAFFNDVDTRILSKLVKLL